MYFVFIISFLESGKAATKSSGLVDTDLQVADPWGNLIKLLLLIGQRLNWDIERDLVNKPKLVPDFDVYSSC